MLRVTVWNENIHDKKDYVRAVYPDGIHGAVAAAVKEIEDVKMHIATLTSRSAVCPTMCLTTPMF